MTILEVVAVIGIVLTALQIGFSFGKNAKNNRLSPRKTWRLLLVNKL